MERKGERAWALAGWLLGAVLVLALNRAAAAGEAAPQGEKATEFNVALTELGATGRLSGCGCNRDWPVERALSSQEGRQGNRATWNGGLLLNPPMTGAKIDVVLIQEVPVHAVETITLDYRGTRRPKTIDVLLDGKMAKRGVELPREANQPFRIDLPPTPAKVVTFVVTGTYPLEKVRGRDGKEVDGAPWGGFARLRVYSRSDLRSLMAAPAGYQVPRDRGAVAIALDALVTPKTFTEVREVKGNPCTILDDQDVAALRAMLKTSTKMQAQYADLKRKLDARIAAPLKVPAARKDKNGALVHLPEREVAKIHNQLAVDICDLGNMYALSGEEKYGEAAKRLLLDYAREFPGYGIGARPGFTHDPSKVFDQRLSDAIWLIQVIRGYDLIYNLPSLTAEERKKIEDDFIKADAYHIAKNSHVLDSATNWSAITTAAVLMAGYACHDQKLVNLGTTGKADVADPDPAATAAAIAPEVPGQRAPRAAGYPLHFSRRCIGDDGLWREGAIGYQFMAMQALIAVAETVRHHGINMYAANHGAMKKLFDSPTWIAYEDLATPGLNDSGSVDLFGYNANVWEYGYRNYRDPNYLTLLKRIPLQLHSRYQIFFNSILYDLDLNVAVPPIFLDSRNFSDVGNGVTRLETPRGQAYVLLDYGPFGSHGHPDKLNLDVFANHEQLLPDPGIVWYEQPLYRQWYHTTVAHNTLVVGEADQREVGGEQIVYLPGETAALQRARVTEAYPGVIADRAVFMLPEYLLDVFGAFSNMPRRYDLAWHLTGATALPAAFAPRQEKFAANGYAALDELRACRSAQGVVLDNVSPREKTQNRLLAAAGDDTEYIAGRGHLPGHDVRPLTLLERREAAATVYANVVEYAGKKTVRKVTTTGGLKEGFVTATVEHADGVDHAYVAYRPEKRQFAGFTTDALQALVRLDRQGAVVAAFLAGGTSLAGKDWSLARPDNGTAAVERTLSGSYLLLNGNAAPARLTLRAPWNKNLKATEIGPRGEKTRDRGAAGETLEVPAGGRLELIPAGGQGFWEKRLAQKKAQQEAVAAKAAAEAATAKQRSAEWRAAAAKAAPQGVDLKIAGKDFSAQGGGKVNVLTDRVAASNPVCQGWDKSGHYLEWGVEVPQAGYYQVGLRYCSEMSDPERQLTVNGQDEKLPLKLRNTGGWSRANDDWATDFLLDPVDGKPLPVRLQAGKNVLRLTNADGKGVNLDYLIVQSLAVGK